MYAQKKRLYCRTQIDVDDKYYEIIGDSEAWQQTSDEQDEGINAVKPTRAVLGVRDLFDHVTGMSAPLYTVCTSLLKEALNPRSLPTFARTFTTLGVPGQHANTLGRPFCAAYSFCH